jgi:tetratricopeptide (TPR) repeat protein
MGGIEAGISFGEVSRRLVSAKTTSPEARWIALLPRAPSRQTFRIFCRRRSPISGRTKPAARWLCLVANRHLTHGHPFACYPAGLIYVNTGNDTAALPFYARALTLNPRYADALERPARIMQRLKRFKEAIADYNALLRINPPNAETLYNLGGAYEGAGQRDDALLGRGIVEFKSARIEPAPKFFESALKTDPASANAFCGRGLALQYLGRVEEAMRDFEHALALKPDLPEGHSNLGALQLLLGDFERGWEGYEYRMLAEDRCKADLPRRWPL